MPSPAQIRALGGLLGYLYIRGDAVYRTDASEPRLEHIKLYQDERLFLCTRPYIHSKDDRGELE
jgi:hypothetical protein